MKYGDRIAYLRNTRNLTQKELSNRTGISRAAISHYEKNRREPDYETLLALAHFFGCTTDYILGKSAEPTLTESQYHEALVEYEDLIKELEPLSPEERKRRIQRLRDFARGMSESD